MCETAPNIKMCLTPPCRAIWHHAAYGFHMCYNGTNRGLWGGMVQHSARCCYLPFRKVSTSSHTPVSTMAGNACASHDTVLYPAFIERSRFPGIVVVLPNKHSRARRSWQCTLCNEISVMGCLLYPPPPAAKATQSKTSCKAGKVVRKNVQNDLTPFSRAHCA